MTRREEIVKATKECRKEYVGLGRHLTSDDIADAFEEGAYWADKTMIDKICDFIIAFNERAKLGIIEPLINVEIFRKAMEGEE